MSIAPRQFLDLFLQFPGDLLFFLLVIGFSLGGLYLAIGHRSRFPLEHATRRFLYSAAGILLVWLVMMGAALLAQAANINANRFMPPLERLAYALTLVVMAWAFLSADFARWQNRSNLFIFGGSLLLALLYLNTAQSWLAASGEAAAFNATEYAAIWSAIPIAIAIAGLALAVLNARHLLDAPLKALFFLIVILGNGLDLVLLSEGDVAGSYLGGARLAYVAGLALFPAIIYRLAVALLENSLVEVVTAASQPSAALEAPATENERPSADPLLAAPSSWSFSAAPVHRDQGLALSAAATMMEPREDSDLPAQIVETALETLGADVGVLARVQDNNYADVAAGYDRVADRRLSGISLNLNEQPTLLEALNRAEQTIMFPEYHAEELADLFRRLNIETLSSVYVQPLMAGGSLKAVLLVSIPYRQADLSVEQIELLRDLGFLAARLLEWSATAAASNALAEARKLENIAAGPVEFAMDADALMATRQELETSFARVTERRTKLASQVAQLKQQLQQQHVRLIETLSDDGGDPRALQRLTAAMDAQGNMRAACEQSALDLLEAETVLRVLNVASGETIAQVIREFLHKEYNLLVSVRDRLRRQVNAMLLIGQSGASAGIAPILQSLADETAQLDLEQEQQRRRLDSITSKLESMGVGSSFANMTHLLIQLYAERKTLAGHLDDLNEERALLVGERERLLAAGKGDSDKLSRQLNHLSADHEQLLNARENMRREQQELLARLDEAEAEKRNQRARIDELSEALAANTEGQRNFDQQVAALTEERDNLLRLRDQLRTKVADTIEAGEGGASDELEDLRATVDRLTEQREQLALALSDARTELESPRVGVPQIHEAAEETEASPMRRQRDLLSGLLRDLQPQITSISDYTELLLTESIGILGAAQLQVLRMVAGDIDQLIKTINEAHGLAELEANSFALRQGDVDVLGVIEDVLQEQAAQFDESDLMLELSLDDHLPPVNIDKDSLKRFITHMLDNARGVSPPGSQIGITLSAGAKVLPGASGPVEAVEIAIRDQGGGIARADLQRVFARKYRRENPGIAGFSDTGVRMSIARAFVRARDGDLWVTSDDEGGSVFHLALPLQLAASIED
ncbi:MAG: hypothetical protein F4X02_12985 [Chloroflexi bacterium]|nr:hypothetical protein [Chloroflexota bacterium]